MKARTLDSSEEKTWEKFVEKHALGTIHQSPAWGHFQAKIPAPMGGEVYLYDASDPLNYPDLIELLYFLESHPSYHSVGMLTSCPAGSEELLKELLRHNFKKIKWNLSLSDENSPRLEKNGILETIYGNPEGIIKHVQFSPIGKGIRAGQLAAGFYCGDTNVLTPDGPCSAEYHVASDLYPNERHLQSIDESRRVYMKPMMFNLTTGLGFFERGARIYIPESMYIDLENNGSFKKEIGLRHLVSYMFSIVENMYNGRPYSEELFRNWLKIENAFEEEKFAMPKDDKEKDFYTKQVKELLAQCKQFIETDREKIYPSGVMMIGGPSFGDMDCFQYENLISKMRADLEKI